MDFVTELSLDGELIGPNQLANDPTETERIERTLDRDFDAFAAQLAHRLGQDNEEELGAGPTSQPAANTSSDGFIESDPLDGTMALLIGYRGAGFSGYAEQPGGLRTVAGELRRALETFLRREVDLTCAGRTDAGVHALGQVVSLPVTSAELELREQRILRALTALTPDDISVRAVYRAPKGFSARFDALSRSYRYRMSTGVARPVLAYDYAWQLRTPLDLDAMRAAALPYLGEHDFKSFCKASSAEGKPTCRNLLALDFVQTEEFGEPLVAMDVRGSSFLHSMVRTLAGTFVEIGQGRRDPTWAAEVLAACDRRAAGPTAPAKGLTFMGVEYAPDVLQPW